ncbi:MAG: hypothetical protein KDA42_03655 [Planctomycetales bacterium]|nr:hypothetical protein [Planctomycetales bacterium]
MICPVVSSRELHDAEPTPLAESQLHGLLRTLYRRQSRIERRNDNRFPFPALVELTPVDGKSLAPVGETLVVVGKDLSEHGFGFFHATPLPFRHAIVAIDTEQNEPLRILIDLSWCRFTRRGWYENGGRFLRVISLQTQAA